MWLGYNTNGLAHHRLADAMELLHELGYGAIGLTLDHGHLNPFDLDYPAQVSATARQLRRLGLRSVIETGARYVLDPRQKHEPTLVTADADGRRRRVEFYHRAIDTARELGSDCVSIWSGVLHDAAPQAVAMQRLLTGLRQTLDYADARGVTLAFEPEPGMFIDTMARYQQLLSALGDTPLRLTLDIGHLHCQGELPLENMIRDWGSQLANVHLEDMRAGQHEHLQFGEGEIDFPPVIAALKEVSYNGGVYVELSRHSHMAPLAARRAYEFLAPLLASSQS